MELTCSHVLYDTPLHIRCSSKGTQGDHMSDIQRYPKTQSHQTKKKIHVNALKQWTGVKCLHQDFLFFFIFLLWCTSTRGNNGESSCADLQKNFQKSSLTQCFSARSLPNRHIKMVCACLWWACKVFCQHELSDSNRSNIIRWKKWG